MKKGILLFATLVAMCVLLVTSVTGGTVELWPTAQGYYSNWTNVSCLSGASEWQCVDENPASTLDYLKTSTSNLAETFTFSDTDSTNCSTGIVNNLTLNYYAKNESATRYRTRSLIRSGGIDYPGIIFSFTSLWGYYRQSYAKNPATTTWWTVAEVDALEAGMKSYSTTNGGGRVAQVYAKVVCDGPLSDLVISDVSFLEYINTNGTLFVNVTTTTMNNGTGPSVPSTTRGVGIETQSWGVSALNPGSSSTTTRSFICSSAHTFIATADYTNTEQEQDETNNVWPGTYIDCVL